MKRDFIPGMVIYGGTKHSSYAAANLCHFYSAHVERKRSGKVYMNKASSPLNSGFCLYFALCSQLFSLCFSFLWAQLRNAALPKC